MVTATRGLTASVHLVLQQVMGGGRSPPQSRSGLGVEGSHPDECGVLWRFPPRSTWLAEEYGVKLRPWHAA